LHRPDVPHVVSRQLGPSTMLTAGGASSRHPVGYIVSMGSRYKVRGVDASGVIARVPDDLAGRDRLPRCQHVSHPMCPNRLPVEAELPVPVAVGMPAPYPTG